MKKITRINVENIPCYVSIGIHEEEKKMGQKLLIDVIFEIDVSKLVTSDKVEDTVSYVDIYNVVQKIGKLKSYSLIEVLGEEIANEVLKFPSILNVHVKVRKPHIPFPDFYGNISIDVIRSKS